MALQPAAEDVLELIALLELEGLPVNQILDDRRALVVLRDELDQFVCHTFQPLR